GVFTDGVRSVLVARSTRTDIAGACGAGAAAVRGQVELQPGMVRRGAGAGQFAGYAPANPIRAEPDTVAGHRGNSPGFGGESLAGPGIRGASARVHLSPLKNGRW